MARQAFTLAASNSVFAHPDAAPFAPSARLDATAKIQAAYSSKHVVVVDDAMADDVNDLTRF